MDICQSLECEHHDGHSGCDCGDDQCVNVAALKAGIVKLEADKEGLLADVRSGADAITTLAQERDRRLLVAEAATALIEKQKRLRRGQPLYPMATPEEVALGVTLDALKVEAQST